MATPTLPTDAVNSYFGYATNRSGSWTSYALGAPLIGIQSITFDIDSSGNLHLFCSTASDIVYLTGPVSSVAFSLPLVVSNGVITNVTDIRVSSLSPTQLRGYYVTSATLNLLTPFTYFGTTFSTDTSIGVGANLSVSSPLFHY